MLCTVVLRFLYLYKIFVTQAVSLDSALTDAEVLFRVIFLRFLVGL